MIEDRARIKFCGSPGCCALVSAVSSDLFNGFQGSVACVVAYACCIFGEYSTAESLTSEYMMNALSQMLENGKGKVMIWASTPRISLVGRVATLRYDATSELSDLHGFRLLGTLVGVDSPDLWSNLVRFMTIGNRCLTRQPLCLSVFPV